MLRLLDDASYKSEMSSILKYLLFLVCLAANRVSVALKKKAGYTVFNLNRSLCELLSVKSFILLSGNQ